MSSASDRHRTSKTRHPVAARRARDAPGGMFGVPRFHPRPDTFFKCAHDLIGDLLITSVLIGCSFLAFGLRMQPTTGRRPLFYKKKISRRLWVQLRLEMGDGECKNSTL